MKWSSNFTEQADGTDVNECALAVAKSAGFGLPLLDPEAAIQKADTAEGSIYQPLTILEQRAYYHINCLPLFDPQFDFNFKTASHLFRRQLFSAANIFTNNYRRPAGQILQARHCASVSKANNEYPRDLNIRAR